MYTPIVSFYLQSFLNDDSIQVYQNKYNQMLSPKNSLPKLKMCRSGNNIRLFDTLQQLQPNPQQQHNQVSFKLYTDPIAVRQPLSSLQFGDADTLFLTRQNGQIEQEIFSIIDQIERTQENNQFIVNDSLSVRLQIEKQKLQMQSMKQIIDHLREANSHLIKLFNLKCKMVGHLAALIRLYGKSQKNRKELKQIRQIQQNLQRAIDQFNEKQKLDFQMQIQEEDKQTLSSLCKKNHYNKVNKRSCQQFSIQTSFQSDQHQQCMISIEQQRQVQSHLQKSIRKFSISCELSISIKFSNINQGLSDDQQIQMLLSDRKLSQNLTDYFKEISAADKEIRYNQKIVKDLQNHGENQASKAFARLLKQHMYLKLCLNRMIQKEHEQQQTNNQRIVKQLKTITKNHEKNEKIGKPQDQQCIIY